MLCNGFAATHIKLLTRNIKERRAPSSSYTTLEFHFTFTIIDQIHEIHDNSSSHFILFYYVFGKSLTTRPGSLRGSERCIFYQGI